ncbi:MAG: hypothetical protein WC910_08235 [Bacteroidales bacterium]|jgi:hypothetical protein
MANNPAVEINGNGKSVTWKWLVGFLAGLLLLIAGSVLSGMQTDIKTLKTEKVDKEQYYRDVNEIKEGLKDIQKYIRRP